ncbi:prolyl-tRNA synthetase associated domain-containing protein [Peribacillus butanolivorans]|uniref:prolyl-tRNA synthetase associated domain-containing protein n=1 Tax=Peribacillus butanolivorans TaxID=421767 RepID=UPI0030C92E10
MARKGEKEMCKQEQKVYAVLAQLEIPFIKHKHIPVYTAEEVRDLDLPITGAHCKNLFLRNRKGDKHFLVIVLEDKYVDLKGLSELIDSTSLSLASSERLNNYLGVYPGAVGPFGLINDMTNHVHVLLDSDLLDKDTINFHPNVNTTTVNLSVRNFRRFLDWINNPVLNVKF